MARVLRKILAMTRTEAALRSALATRPLHASLNDRMRRTVADPERRERLNRKYVAFSPIEKALFHALYSKAFRDVESTHITPGTWSVDFLGSSLRMPLTPERIWLDWDNASGITGHDIEVKSTYESLIKTSAPRVFFDVGANYGTHSLLFLSQGIDVISFEPNPACCAVFEEMCEINGVTPRIERVAVSDKEGSAEFVFPTRDTWLGSMVDETKENLKGQSDLQKITVEVTTIDDHVARTGLAPDLMKIDTEGNEVRVLRGSKMTLEAKRPLVIFEANTLGDRDALCNVLNSAEYTISELPIADPSNSVPLTRDGFISSAKGNFIGIPRD